MAVPLLARCLPMIRTSYQYINCRALEDRESRYDEGDVGALESVAAFLADATPVEQEVLAAEVERALAAELASPGPRATRVRACC
jgi:hypothetical protein